MDRAALERALRRLDELDPQVAFRPDVCPIPANLFELVTEEVAREITEHRRAFDEWLRFMISVDWLEHGFPPGDVY